MSETRRRYRGLPGALAYGLFLLAIVGVLAALAAGYLYQQTRDGSAVQFVLARVLAVGGSLALAATLCRWLAKAETDRLVSTSICRGDWAAIGALAGLFLAGSFVKEGVGGRLPGSGPQVGTPIEFVGPTLDGGEFRLADHRGSVVVVDFWATWCKPCVKSLPDLVTLAEKHKDAGLKVVGINLDYQRAALIQFLGQLPLPWPQVIFEEKDKMGWNSPLAKQFGVEAIPHILVIDKDGKLYASDVHGPDLARAVAGALGGQKPPPPAITARLFTLLVRGALLAPVGILAASLLAGAGVGLALELLVRAVVGRRSTPVGE
ncbi:MAG: TlpA family protein disulfide reductase [Gemmataceae bacterium]|nr:TlpA family protein disulfide reductase [Gemmataceae bacterium]